MNPMVAIGFRTFIKIAGYRRIVSACRVRCVLSSPRRLCLFCTLLGAFADVAEWPVRSEGSESGRKTW